MRNMGREIGRVVQQHDDGGYWSAFTLRDRAVPPDVQPPPPIYPGEWRTRQDAALALRKHVLDEPTGLLAEDTSEIKEVEHRGWPDR